MKLGMMTVVAVCGALAFAATGCKYNKAKNGSANGADANAAGSDISHVQDADSGAIVTDRPFGEIYKPVEGANFAPVYFAFDSTVVPQGEVSKVEEVAKDLQANPTHVVVVEGNCDERGSNEYNLSLGENRAIVVRDYLVKLGIAAERIQTKSYGEEKPAVQGHNDGAWAKNRRDEFALYQR